jgi:hypothetical protein
VFGVPGVYRFWTTTGPWTARIVLYFYASPASLALDATSPTTWAGALCRVQP